MPEKSYFTQKKYEELEQRLKELKEVKRREVADKIKKARAFGDISENAEYDAAKEEQGKIEGEINELENSLKYAQIIDEDNVDTTCVNIGCKVKVSYMGKKVEYIIVGTRESNFKQNKISNESPIGKVLLGKRKNDKVEVATPNGNKTLTILDIKNI